MKTQQLASDTLNQHLIYSVSEGVVSKISSTIRALFGLSDTKKAKTGSVRTEFYRGHLLKRNLSHPDYWTVKITDKSLVGKLEYVKKAVDQWCDFKVVVGPEFFEKNEEKFSEQQSFDYKEFKIKNDRGGENDWYLTYRGKLMKGSKDKIMKAIDRLEQKRQEAAQAEQMS